MSSWARLTLGQVASTTSTPRSRSSRSSSAGAGRRLLLFGEDDHPEVRGLLSYAGEGAFVFETPEELAVHPLDPQTPYFLAAQTTQDRQGFEQIKADLSLRLQDEVVVLQTICDATRLRQDEAINLAAQADCVIVAGGKASGNTRRLAQVIEAQQTPTILVETVDDLHGIDVLKFRSMGLTAGASTPKRIIDEIEAHLRAL